MKYFLEYNKNKNLNEKVQIQSMVTRQKILFQANTQKHVRPEADTTIN